MQRTPTDPCLLPTNAAPCHADSCGDAASAASAASAAREPPATYERRWHLPTDPPPV